MLQEAIELALVNNLYIEISRKFEKIAKFDLKAARGFFQPRLTGQTYYDRTTTPNISIFSLNPKTTNGTLLGNATLQGYVPSQGTVLLGSLNNTRLTTDNPISILSPQLNTSLGFNLIQPMFR